MVRGGDEGGEDKTTGVWRVSPGLVGVYFCVTLGVCQASDPGLSPPSLYTC